MRLRRDLLIFALLAGAAGSAAADPISLVVALTSIGFSGAVAAFIVTYGATIAMVGYGLYSSSSAKRKQKAAAARQRADYNASLEDRMATVMSNDVAHRYVYGTSFVGGAIVAMFTSDRPAAGPGGSFGTEGKSQDGLRHLVMVLAAHQCEAVLDIKVDGTSLGTLDAGGFATSPEFSKTRTVSRTVGGVVGAGGVYTLPARPAGSVTVDLSATTGFWDDWQTVGTTSVVGSTATFPIGAVGAQVTFTYTFAEVNSVVRVQRHLGSPGEQASAYLMSVVPSQWTAAHRLSGYCYLVVTLDLNERRFQGGPPSVLAQVQGKRLFDPRDGQTRWSANPALCAADLLQSPLWAASSQVSVITSDLIAAANVCDEILTVGITNQRRYTCNGVVSSDDGPEAALEDMTEAMAGAAFVAGGWRILAGAWTTPVAVLDVNQADGDVEITQVGTRWQDVCNGVRGTLLPDGETATKEFAPYSNSTLVASDGQELWDNVAYPFTNAEWRCRNLARIKVEASRNGLALRWPASMEHWGLQPGDRVWVNYPDMGFAMKTFRVTDWSFSVNTPVTLMLQEDTAAVYDANDQTVVDQTPNTNLPNPYILPVVQGMSATSGTSELRILGDGTVIPTVRLSWSQNPSMTAGGSIVIRHRSLIPGRDAVNTTRLPGDQASFNLSGYTDGEPVLFQARYENAVAESDWRTYTHTVIGKTQPPSNVTAASITYNAQSKTLEMTWAEVPDADIDVYEVRATDAGWGSLTGAHFRGRAASCPVPPTSSTWFVRAFDTTGRFSLASRSATFSLPSVPQVTGITHSFADTSLTSATVTLRWTGVDPPFGLGGYRVSYPGAPARTTSADFIELPADWIGNRNFTVVTVDRFGATSTPVNYAATKLAPAPVTNLRAQVIDNTVLLFWNLPARTSLPLSHVLIKKGATWATAALIGTKDGGFTTVFELSGGTYTYWLATIDTDNNESAPVALVTTVAQPPDFVFNAAYTWNRTGPSSNAFIDGGRAVLPVNTTETWTQHFVNNAWASPQAQITAGRSIYAQPGLSGGTYEETFDYGVPLASSSVTVDVSSAAVEGTSNIVPTISVSLNNSTWTDYAGATQVFAVNFRYIKVRLTVTQTTAGALREITDLRVRLDSKLKTDSNTLSVSSADTLGTVVNFSTEFVDVISFQPSPLGIVARVAVGDFSDNIIVGTYTVTSNVVTVNATAHNLLVGQRVRLAASTGNLPIGVYTVASVTNADTYTCAAVLTNTGGTVSTYPNSGRIYLYDSAGTRQSGLVAWTVRGS